MQFQTPHNTVQGDERVKSLLQEAHRKAALPPATDPDSVALTVFALFEHAIQPYKPWYAVNNEDREYYKGNQSRKKPKDKSNVVDNETQAAIDTMQPRILDSIGESDLNPLVSDDVDAVESLNQRVKYAKRQCGLISGRKKVVKDVLEDGGAIVKCFSSVIARQIDWRRVVREPESASFNESLYIIDQVLESYADTVHSFGRKAKDAATDTRVIEANEDLATGPPHSDSGTSLTLASAPVNESSPVTRYTYDMTGSEFERAERVLRLEIWIHDKTTKGKLDTYENSRSGAENYEEYQEPLYPHGRVVNVVIAADKDGMPVKSNYGTPQAITLRDRPNPLVTLYEMTSIKDDSGKGIIPGRFPFTQIMCYDADFENVWGLSAVRRIMPLQKKLNEQWNQLFDNISITNNPTRYYSGYAGIKKGSIKGKSGEVVILAPGNDLDINKIVKYGEIPPIAQHIIPVIREIKDAIRNVSGVLDVSRGEKPGGVTAASAITALQVKADDKMLLNGARVSDGYKEVTENLCYIAQDFDREIMEYPDESYDSDEDFIEHDPEAVRNKKVRVTGERRMTIGEILQVLEGGVKMEEVFPGAMKMILMHADDPRLRSIYLKMSEQNKKDADQTEQGQRKHEVALEMAKRAGGNGTQPEKQLAKTG